MTYNRLGIVLILLIPFFATSCKKRNKISSINWHLLPKVEVASKAQIYFYQKDSSSYRTQEIFTKKLRVHIYINGNCNTCVDKLNEWGEYIRNFKYQEHYDVLIHLFAYDYENFKRINRDIIHFNYNMILDSENTFFLQNSHLDIDLQKYQILTDDQNRMFDFGKLLNSNILDSYLYNN